MAYRRAAEPEPPADEPVDTLFRMRVLDPGGAGLVGLLVALGSPLLLATLFVEDENRRHRPLLFGLTLVGVGLWTAAVARYLRRRRTLRVVIQGPTARVVVDSGALSLPFPLNLRGERVIVQGPRIVAHVELQLVADDGRACRIRGSGDAVEALAERWTDRNIERGREGPIFEASAGDIAELRHTVIKINDRLATVVGRRGAT